MLLETRLNCLVEKINSVDPPKIPGLCKMLTACLEFLEDPALIDPLPFTSYEKRTGEFLSYCEGYLRHKRHWTDLLQRLDLRSARTACELCPGVASKALWGLAATSFRGNASVLDCSPEALSRIGLWNELLFLPFPVEAIQADLFTFKSKTFDLLLANHILDDLLLHAMAGSLSKKEEQTEEDFFLQKCTYALSGKNQIALLTERIAKILSHLLNPGGQLVLLEYPSLYLRSHLQLSWEEALQQTRELLFKTLKNLGLTERKILEARVFSM